LSWGTLVRRHEPAPPMVWSPVIYTAKFAYSFVAILSPNVDVSQGRTEGLKWNELKICLFVAFIVLVPDLGKRKCASIISKHFFCWDSKWIQLKILDA
jgi:hypothetical protein